MFSEALSHSLGFGPGGWFERQPFGADRLILGPKAIGGDSSLPPPLYTADSVRAMPIIERAKKDLLRIEDPNQPDYMPGLTSAQKKAKLPRISFTDYLLYVVNVAAHAYWV